MSEQQPQIPKQEKLEAHTSIEHQVNKLNELREKAENAAHEHAESGKIERLQKAVESKAVSGKEIHPTEHASDHAPSATFVSRELKEMALTRSLNTARRHMNAPERVLSKVMHNKAVSKASDVAGVTVARPSGILGGGLLAAIGSGILLILVKHYGYTYNYLVFIMLFVGGFLLGSLLEIVLRTFWRRRAL